MKILKAIVPLALVATPVLIKVASRVRHSGKPSKVISDIVKSASEAAATTTEKTFGGITQSEIDEIITNTHKAIKAVINGDTLELRHKSNSGKQDSITSYTLDVARGLIPEIIKGHPNANVPLIFGEKIIDAMKQKANNNNS